VLTTLEAKGLLARERSATDGRLVVVSMTDAGRELMQTLFPEFNEHEQTIAGAADDRRVELAELLRSVTLVVEKER